MRTLPGAQVRFLDDDPSHQRKMTGHNRLSWHTMVGSLAGTDAMFHEGGYTGTESHLGSGFDGTVYQWVPFMYSADANLDGWYDIISWETADTGPGFAPWSGSNVPPWTPEQVEAHAQGLAWLCSKKAHADCPATWECHKNGIPLTFLPDSHAGRRGIVVHREGVDSVPPYQNGYRQPGCEHWSTSPGKVCPGDHRISQAQHEVLERAKEIMGTDTPWPDYGDKSPAVAVLHRKLMTAGFYHGGDAPDRFWDDTKEAIAALQRAQGWTGSDADGVIGPTTWDIIQKLPISKEPPAQERDPDVREVMVAAAKFNALVRSKRQKHPKWRIFEEVADDGRAIYQKMYHWGEDAKGPDTP